MFHMIGQEAAKLLNFIAEFLTEFLSVITSHDTFEAQFHGCGMSTVFSR